MSPLSKSPMMEVVMSNVLVTIWDHGTAGRLPISHVQTNRVRCTTFQIFLARISIPFFALNNKDDQCPESPNLPNFPKIYLWYNQHDDRPEIGIVFINLDQQRTSLLHSLFRSTMRSHLNVACAGLCHRG